MSSAARGRARAAWASLGEPEAVLEAEAVAARTFELTDYLVNVLHVLDRTNDAAFSSMLDQVIEARPDRIAAYSYAHLPETFKAQKQIKQVDLCPPEIKLALLGITIEKLSAAGYVYIGMDHFALPGDELAVALGNGTLQRNFQGYSTRAGLDLVGLGMSAIGQVGNLEHKNVSFGKAGRQRWLGRRPHNRGVSMNPVDHPHGGGEGKTSGGRHPVTPWGKPTKGAKTRNNKRTQKFIVKGRKKI